MKPEETNMKITKGTIKQFRCQMCGEPFWGPSTNKKNVCISCLSAFISTEVDLEVNNSHSDAE